ncbi:MAG: hypothetical protein LBT24_03370, partial [Tannerella sp.]|nr:hypothetical protein [Tannerella sp.]
MQNNILDNPIFEAIKISKNKCFPFWKTKCYILKETGKTVKKETIYFNKDQLQGFIKQFSEQVFSEAKPIEIVASRGNCYMDIVFTEDNLFVAVQLFEYVPFVFQPVNGLYLIKEQSASDFLSYIKVCKTMIK